MVNKKSPHAARAAQKQTRAAGSTYWLRNAWKICLVVWLVARLGAYATLKLSEDVFHYFEYAQACWNGARPYVDFKYEYPPWALPVFLLPRLFTDSLQTYWRLFAGEMLLFDMAIVALLWRLPRLIAGGEFTNAVARSTAGVVCFYVLLTTLVWPMPLARFDLVCGAIALAWGHETLRHKRLVLADFLLALGFWVKLVPALLGPMYLAYLFARQRPKQRFLPWIISGGGARRLASLTAFVILLGLPWLMLSGSALGDFITYHQQRGIQVESTYAGLFFLSHMFQGVPLHFGKAYGAMEMFHDWTPAVAQSAFYIMAVGLIAVTWRFARLLLNAPNETERRHLLIAGCIATWSVFILLNKVFSPQYLVWMAPWLALLWHRKHAGALAVYTIMFLLTGLGNDNVFNWLFVFSPGAITLLVVRNLLFAVAVLILCQLLVKQGDSGRLSAAAA